MSGTKTNYGARGAVYFWSVLAAAVVMIFLCCPAQAAGETVLDYETIGDGVRILGADSVGTDLIVPREIDGMPVVSIGQGAFEGEQALESVVLPYGIREIEKDAFRSCRSLAYVDMPEEVTSIGDEAFAYCDKLHLSHLPRKLESIGDSCFWYCTSMESMIIPEGITRIAPGAFGQCGKLSYVALPESLESIGENAFAGTAITEIVIPDGTTQMGDAVFSGCADLVSLALPRSVTDVPAEMVSDCASLAEVMLPRGLETIGMSAFAHCPGLAAFAMPAGVREIGENAFWGCTSLASIRVPFGVTIIEPGTFWDCSELTEVTIPSSVRQIGSMAFYGTALKDVYYEGSPIEWDSISIEQDGYTQIGAGIEQSNAALEDAEIHFGSVGPLLPDGVRLRDWSALFIDEGASIGPLLRGLLIDAPKESSTIQSVIGQFVVPPEVQAYALSANGALKSADLRAATGDILVFDGPGSKSAELVIVVDGDVTGSGVMNLSQLVRISAAYSDSAPLTGPYLAAGDFTGTNTIGLADLVREAELWAEAQQQAA